MSFVRSLALRLSHAMSPASKRRLKWQLGIPDVGASLELLRAKGFSPRVAIDIGGFVGEWTVMCREIWPDTSVCIFEPQQDKQAGLKALAQRLGRVEVKPTCLGETPDTTVEFYLEETGSSTMQMITRPDARKVVMPSTTLARAVAGTPFEKPDIVKIDVQGAELAVMRGGLEVIRHAEVVMLEVSFIEEYKGAPLFYDIVTFMHAQGFVVHDIAYIWRNTCSRSMNEADIIFTRADSRLRDPSFYRN